MRWHGRRQSSNVEDRRGMRAAGSSRLGGGGLLRLVPLVFRFLGFKGTFILLACVGAYSFFTGDLSGLLTGNVLERYQSIKEKPQYKWTNFFLYSKTPPML